MSTIVKALVDALPLTPADSERNFANHAAHHRALHAFAHEVMSGVTIPVIHSFVGKYSQTGENAPVLVEELVNTMGLDAPEPSRLSAGYYLFTWPTGTLGAKTFVAANNNNSAAPRFLYGGPSGSTRAIVFCWDTTGTQVDENAFFLTVQVYDVIS